MMNFVNKKDNEANENDTKGEETTEEKKKVKKQKSIHHLEISGVKSFIEAKSKPAKLLWLALLILALAMFIWQLYKIISNYINSPIVSTYTITTVPSMDMPIVYLCPTSFISSLYLNNSPGAEMDAIALKEEMGIVWDYVDFLATGNLTDSPPQQSKNPLAHVHPAGISDMRNKSVQFNQTDRLLQSDLDAEKFFKEATVDLGNNVRYCTFRSFMFEEFPCENITREVLDPEYGKCYVIDMGGRRQEVQSQALVMAYNVRSNWYPTSPMLSPLFNGVHLSIQRKYNVDKSGESILLTPGNYYRVDLSAQHQVFQSFHHPYKQECLKDDAYPPFKIFNVSYTQQSCLYDCSAQAIMKACNCIPPIDRSLFADGIANATNGFCKIKHLQCIRSVTKDRSATSDLRSCRDRCQRPCEDWRYSVRATSMDLYKYGFEEGKPVHDVMYILVSFSQMEYTEFKQDNSKTPDQMVADIGGEAGLWLGAGMLTLLQMPIVAISLCGGCCKKGKKKLAGKTKEENADAK